MRLTRSGERLFDRAKRLLNLNDEIWAELAGSAIAGQVRLGVPYDLVGTLLAPVLKTYAETYPQVEISLVCASSPELAAALAAGTIDLAVIEERVGPSAGECLAIDNTFHPANQRLNLATTVKNLIARFGIRWDDAANRNGHFASFSWRGAA